MDDPNRVELAGKIKEVLGVEPDQQQLNRIDESLGIYRAWLAGGYADDRKRPSDIILFLRQMKGHVDKAVEMGMALDAELGKNFSMSPLLLGFAYDIQWETPAKSVAEAFKGIRPEDVHIDSTTIPAARERFDALMHDLTQLSKGIDNQVSAIDGCKRKGPKGNPCLQYAIRDLADTFEDITGLKASVSNWDPYPGDWDEGQPRDQGMFTNFVVTILKKYGIQPDVSLRNYIRKTV